MSLNHSFFLSLGLHLALIILTFTSFKKSKTDWELEKSVPVQFVSLEKLTQSPPPVEKKFNKYKEISKISKKTQRRKEQKTIEKKKENSQQEKGLNPSLKKEKTPLKKVEPLKENVSKNKVQQKESSKQEKFDAKSFEETMNALEKNVASPTDTVQKLDPKAFQSDNISDKLSVSELDALRQQIQECWYIQQTLWEDHNLSVEATLDIGPDQKVKNITIAPPKIGTNRAAFQAAADSVKQALFAPECTPLALPPEKYEQWKCARFIFSPKGVA